MRLGRAVQDFTVRFAAYQSILGVRAAT